MNFVGRPYENYTDGKVLLPVPNNLPSINLDELKIVENDTLR